MAFNGSGLFNIDSTGQPVSANTLIESADFNALTDDLATGLSNCITKDGQQTVTANLPMASYRHTGVGNASARTDYAAAGQVQDGKLNWVDGGGTADAITATYLPAITALVDGQLCCVRATAANATTTPTFAPNGLTARTIVKTGGAALVAGDIVADGHELLLRYDLTNTRWELLNPAYTPATLGLVIGTDVQAYDADLATIAGLTATTDNFIQSKSSAWASRTPTQVTADLIALVGDSGAGGTKGLAPAPAAGDAAAGKFLKADATWAVPGGAGKIKQIVFAHKTDTFSTASTTFTDVTGLSVSLTPTNASNKVIVLSMLSIGNSVSNFVNAKVVRDSTDILVGDAAGSRIRSALTTTPAAALMTAGTIVAVDSPGDTSAHTYKIQIAATSGTAYINRSGTDTDSTNYGRQASSIIAVEYEP